MVFILQKKLSQKIILSIFKLCLTICKKQSEPGHYVVSLIFSIFA